MSEEMKNLNEQPEQAPVEKTAEAPKLPLSKKTIGIICGAVAAVLVLVLVLVLALGGNKTPDHTHNYVDGKCECGATDPNYVAPHTHSYVDGKCACGETDPNYVAPVVEKDYTLGLGIVFGDITNKQLNATIATVVTDANGVIVSCKIDAVQNKYTIADKVTFTLLDTKKELGYNYNMAAYGSDNNGDGIVKEWFEQAAIFEQYVVGKTAAELKTLEYQEVNNHMISKDEALLAAGCTIQIGEFVNAVVKACEDEQSMSFKTAGEIALGLGVNNADNGTTGDEFEATVKMNIDYAATVLVDGKIVAALNDAAQPQATIEDGEVTATAKLISKRDLKEGYNMAAYGSDNNDDGIVLEWYKQSEIFSNYVVGLTPAEVAGLKTQLVNNHLNYTDDALLSAGCTMQITGIQAVLAESAGYAEYTLGLGIVFGDITNAQINATIATVVTDANGVIVSCKIDAVQNKYKIEDKVSFTNLLTKKELGYNYNMAAYGTPNYGTTVKEWFEQAAIFEQYVVGKTAAELEALEYQEVNNHWISKDEDLLSAGCTIQIGEFVNAVVKACNDEQSTKFYSDGKFTLGLGVNNADNGTTGDDFEATVKMNIDYAATVVVDGKIVAALNDAAQPQATIVEGEVTATAKLISKRDLKEGYNMAAFGSDNNGDGIVLEWYKQSAAFSNYIAGLTSAEVEGLETAEVNNHLISTDDALLSAGCTMQITGIMAVVVEAVADAK